MKARFSYPLVFFLPSAFAAVLAGIAAVGVGAGILWLFVYGDNTWPESAETLIMATSAVTALLVLAGLFFASYTFGKHREMHGGISRRHVMWAGVVTVLLPALVVLRECAANG